MKLLKVFCLSLCSLLFFSTNAQILRVDKTDLAGDSSRYFLGRINVNFNVNNQSATAEEEIIFRGFGGVSDLVYIAKEHAYILISKTNYFSSTGGPFISNGYAHFRVNFLRKRKLSYETYTQGQYDDGRNMQSRFLAGGGLRWQLFSKGKADIRLGAGTMYERERWKVLDQEDTFMERNLWKTSNYIRNRIKFNEEVNLNLIIYYQGGYDHESDVFRNRVSGDVVFSIKLTERLFFTAQFSGQFEDKPIIPIPRTVYSFTNGLDVKF